MQGLFSYPGSNETWEEPNYDTQFYDSKADRYKTVTYNCTSISSLLQAFGVI